jgi:spore germination cell wall hydrolase CwlJ-like protein
MLQDILISVMLIVSHTHERLEKTCLALNIYYEARGESLHGQEAVAYITTARANDNVVEFGGPSICGVVFRRNVREDGKLIPEFSWTSMRPLAKHRLKAQPWNTAWNIAEQWIDGNGKAREDLSGARYYLNLEHASSAGLCWFRRNAVPLGTTVGNHSFYRRPATVSEWMEVRSVPPDCYSQNES